MAILLVEGFDAYNGATSTSTAVGVNSRWTFVGNAGSMVTGRFGGQAYNSFSTTTDRGIGISVPGGASTGSFGNAMYTTNNLGNGTELVVFGTGPATSTTNRQFSLISANGSFGIATGTSSLTTIYNTNVPIPIGQWFYIEIEFVISNTVGEVRLYLNGSLIGSATGLDTQTSTTTSTWNYLTLSPYWTNAQDRYHDDVYVTDTATRLGEQRVVTVVPTSDSTPSQWAASGGAVAPYTMVDEVLCNGDTDYIFDGTVGDRAVFNMASTGATPLAVNAVQIGTFSRKTDTGYRAIQLQYVDSGGTAYSSSDIVLSAAYQRQVNLLQTNPATSTAWTPSEANALKTGVRISV